MLVRTAREQQFAVLILQDTGRGMPQEVVEKVFVPFYTTKIGGTGLGMVFVRQIVDEHRGVITLESKVGRGTTVTIRLPHRFTDSPEVGDEFPPVAPPVAPAAPSTPEGGVGGRLTVSTFCPPRPGTPARRSRRTPRCPPGKALRSTGHGRPGRTPGPCG